MVSNNRKDDYRNELNLWDAELINVVDPLEKNLSLLKVLYPITFIVSILIAGILGFIDIAMYIVSVKKLDIPKNSRDAFEVLAHNEIINNDILEKL